MRENPGGKNITKSGINEKIFENMINSFTKKDAENTHKPISQSYSDKLEKLFADGKKIAVTMLRKLAKKPLDA